MSAPPMPSRCHFAMIHLQVPGSYPGVLPCLKGTGTEMGDLVADWGAEAVYGGISKRIAQVPSVPGRR